MEVLSMFKTGIGIMSGTSVDGLDLIAVTFNKTGNSIKYEIHDSITIHYSSDWRNRLLHSTSLSSTELRKLEIDFSIWIANQVNSFKEGKNWNADFIASHGHTVFHRPEQGYTLQIGSGATIAALTSLTTVCDFRQSDISIHGQGAPLVPIGDELLFSEYDFCLNLGGFANVSFKENGIRKAFDICALNVVLNALARRLGAEYDDQGKVASTGNIIPELLDELENLNYYKMQSPKSLGTEWVDETISPLLIKYSEKNNVPDLLATFGTHFANQISMILNMPGKTLITGGGARNTWLINLIKLHSISTVELPENDLIDNKESLIFALLGYLRLLEIPNTLPSVTGALRPISSGAVYKG